MNIVAIGINHRTAPLEVRERLWLSTDEIRAALPVLHQRWFSECFLVSTCNRTELYGIYSTSKVNPPSVDSIGRFLIELKSAGAYVRQEHLYALNSSLAVNHLFKVASGVDSMVVGDVQILSQIKEGFNVANEQKTVGIFLNRLVQAAYRVGKRTRTETRLGDGAVSVSYAAVELATKIFEDLSRKSALILGAGETGKLTARHLLGKKIGKMLIANRTRSKAEELASSLGGNVTEFDRLSEELVHVDVVVTSVNTPQYVLTAELLAEVMKKRSNKPLFLIDIGVPRNVDPLANKIENIFLHDLDALSGIVQQNLEQRRSEISKVNEIILQELRDFHHWYDSLEVNPTVADLHAHFEQIRQSEVEKNVNRFSSTGDRELLDLVTKRIVNKLLHIPTTMLKNGHEEPDELKRIHIIRTLFGLNKDSKTDS